MKYILLNRYCDLDAISLNNLRLLLLQVREHYCDVPVYVMANGVQEDPARFKDSLRVYYLYNYINEALKGDTHAHTSAVV